MILPDFTGMDPDEVIEALADRYPHVSYHFHTYSSPKEKRDRNAAVLYRIIRQKSMGNNQLEFIISPFYVTNE